MGETIAELIAFVAIGFVLWRYVVPPARTMMRNQQETIRKQVENARTASERLEQAERKLQEAVAESRTEAAKIRDAARADAQRIVEDLREFANREVERIKQRGQDDLESLRLQVVRELRARIGQQTVSVAADLVAQRLSDDKRRAATVDRFLDELEAMSAREPAEVTAGAEQPARKRPRARSTAASKGDA